MTHDGPLLIDRRKLLKNGGSLGVVMAAPAILTRAAWANQELIVADPGGPYRLGYGKAFYEPFEKATGIKVINVARNAEPIAQFRAMVETQSYNWDVCTLALSARDILEKRGFLDPINLASADMPGLMPDALTPVWLGVDVYSTNMAYRTDKFDAGKVPMSWSDFWNIEKFPGRRSLRKNPVDTLEQALLADGVPLDKLYPLDVERAYTSLEKIKPYIDVWWTGGAQSGQLIQSGEVDMIALWNARGQAIIDGGAPVKIVWNQGLYSIEGWGIPKGSPRAEMARQFVKFCAGPQQQALFTEFLAYGPTNLKAYENIPAQRAERLPTFDANLQLMTIAREDWWSTNRSEMVERFNIWILR